MDFETDHLPITAENQFFLPIRDFCQRRVVICSPDDSLVDVVGIMREKNISSVVVVQDGHPCGVVTDRDLRNKVIAQARQPRSLPVREIMSTPVATITETSQLYDALYQMSRRGIHRLVVVDKQGQLSGIITDSDILRLQSHTPHQLILDIEQAENISDLKIIHTRIQELVARLHGTGTPIRDIVRLIAHLNDQVVIRLISLLRIERYPDLPTDFAFIVMGSEGRGEQTLSTDQDNGIIYADHLDAEALRELQAFAEDLIGSLISIGVPECVGGIMASNSAWRRSVRQWKTELERWISTPSPENILKTSMFLDVRTLYGDARLETAVTSHIYSRIEHNRLFLTRMAQNMLNFTPPLGWFGRIHTERSGAHKGQLNIKKAGIFAITDGVKSLALEAQALSGSTHERLEHLANAGVLPSTDAADLAAALDLLVRMRLRSQITALHAGHTPDNYIALEQLNRMEQGELRLALENVVRFQSFVRHHFKLHLVRE
jgi:CBS domain-containing protein